VLGVTLNPGLTSEACFAKVVLICSARCAVMVIGDKTESVEDERTYLGSPKIDAFKKKKKKKDAPT
jgi:hypothetical protein